MSVPASQQANQRGIDIRSSGTTAHTPVKSFAPTLDATARARLRRITNGLAAAHMPFPSFSLWLSRNVSRFEDGICV